jgi:propanol-preferring alcohol dehydrogenase
LGHLVVQFGKALGLRDVAIDVRDEAFELVKECCADTIIDGRLGKEKCSPESAQKTGLIGADATTKL